jgi:hypothetical protein
MAEDAGKKKYSNTLAPSQNPNCYSRKLHGQEKQPAFIRCVHLQVHIASNSIAVMHKWVVALESHACLYTSRTVRLPCCLHARRMMASEHHLCIILADVNLYQAQCWLTGPWMTALQSYQSSSKGPCTDTHTCTQTFKTACDCMLKTVAILNRG